MTYTEARLAVRSATGPLATVYACPHCTLTIRVPKGIRGVGRSYGLRVGGAAAAQMASHIFREHRAAPVAREEA